MRRLLHLLVVIAVLFCALHVGEEAYAFEAAGTQALEPASADDESDGSSPQDAATHSMHHHCPVSGDLFGGPAFGDAEAVASLVFTRPVAALGSLSQAPPIEPPLA